MTKSRNMSVYVDLFLTFFKIGAFTFGGGYAMIPLIQSDVVEKKRWINEEEMLDMIAIAESTPGVMAVNSATFVGYRIGGFWGSVCATIGVVIPSFFIILIITLFLDKFRSNPWVDAAFKGIRAGVVVLIVSAVVKLFKQCKVNVFNLLLMAAGFVFSAFLDFNVIGILVFSGAVGLVYQLATVGPGGRGEGDVR